MKTMKRSKLFTISIFLISILFTACPFFHERIIGMYGDFEWELARGCCSPNRHMVIINYHGLGGNIELPRKIEGEPVVMIGENAFRNKGLTGVIIPNSVEGIGDNAFRDNFLTDVYIPDSVQGLGTRSFRNNRLESIRFGSVGWVGVEVFYGNPLTMITIGGGVWLGNPLLGFRSGFEDAYEANGRAAGTYTIHYPDGSVWVLVALVE
jgi:hypothetical protein